MFFPKKYPTHPTLSQLSQLSTELNRFNICFLRGKKTYREYGLELSAHPTHPTLTTGAGNA